MVYTDENRKDDFQWFLDNYDSLYSKYGHKFFAIQNKNLLGVFDNKIEALDTIAKDYDIGTFIVQECNGNESAYMCYITSWELIN